LFKPLQIREPLRNVRLVDPRRADWEREAQERERAAYERGVREGENALAQQLVQQRSELLQVQNGLFAALRNTIPQIAHESESALVSLAVEVATRLVAGLPISEEMVASCIRDALAQVKDSAGAVVLVHPDDLALLRKTNNGAPFETQLGDQITIEADATVSRGGCVVRTRFGCIDAQREKKLELLKESLEAA
jgi:flagellar assembly protein FliH